MLHLNRSHLSDFALRLVAFSVAKFWISFIYLFVLAIKFVVSPCFHHQSLLIWLHFRGYKRFFRRAALETSEFLKDDSLVLNCTVGVVRTRLECPKQFAITVPPSDIGQGLKAFLDSGAGCDIVFQVGDEQFKAHKLILAARSPVFKAQFFGQLGDSSVDKVVVKDVEPFIFKVMLLVFYASTCHHWKKENKKI